MRVCTLDKAGSPYGATYSGGRDSHGTVFQLTPAMSGWTENILYAFQGGSDGGILIAGPILDQSGNLYGATAGYGSGGGGTVFELTPATGGWTLNTLYSFAGTGGPTGTLVMDGAGNLYGTTYSDGAYGYGNVFELTPHNGSWFYTDLHDFTGGSDGGNPNSNVVFDTSGNLYGTASTGGSQGVGVVWEITP